MSSLSSYLTLPLFVISFLLTGAELFTSVRLSMLERVDRLLPADSALVSPIHKNSADSQENVYQAQRAYENTLSLPLVTKDLGYSSAQLLYRIGLLERSEERRLEYFCKALGNLGQALVRQPFDSQLLVSWANLRQLLSGIECHEPMTTGNFEEVARYALSQDGTNAEVLFSSAQIFLWAGKKDEAARLLRAFLEFGLSTSERQLSFIDRQLNQGADIRAIVPGHFPQIVEWSSRIRRRRPSLFVQAASVLSELQLEAVLKNEADLKSEKIPVQLYFDRLASLLEVVSSSQVRKRIDAELSRYYGLLGQEQLQKYLDSRREYDSLAVNRALLAADTRPLKTPLNNWLSSQWVTLNHFYNSVGFYAPEGAAIKFIELVGSKDSPLMSEIALRVLVSNTNQQWDDVTGDITIKSIDIAGTPRVVITVPDISSRYWKINFASASREGRFVNPLYQMVQVYGRESK